MAEKQTFVMYKSWKQLFKSLPAEQAKDLICAVYDYQDEGCINTDDPAVVAMFNMMKELFDKDSQKYEKTIQKRKEAGSSGGKAKAGKSKQMVANAKQMIANAKHDLANGSKSKQNAPVYEYEYVYEYDNDSVNDIVSDVPSEQKADSTVVESVSAEPTVMTSAQAGDQESNAARVVSGSYRVPFQEIVNLYNQTCPSLPSVRAVSDTRRKLIRSRYHDSGLDEIKIVFEKAEASDFLTGRKHPYWTGCGFDWLMKPSNFLKVLEGNYDNKEPAKSGSGNTFLDMILSGELDDDGGDGG